VPIRTLEGRLVILRKLTSDDTDAWLAGEDEEYLRAFEEPPSTPESVARFLRKVDHAWRHDVDPRHWAIVDRASGEVAGHVDYRGKPSVTVSYNVFADFRRGGRGREAVTLALGHAHDHGATAAVFKILDWNAPSIALATGLGATLVGTEPSHADGTFAVYRLPL
jgi:RimJ/RimL family protein N-acetyltransferase